MEILAGSKIDIDGFMSDWRCLFCGQHRAQKLGKLKHNIADLEALLWREDTLLDVGCNTGEMYRVLRHDNYTGLDFNPAWIETARRNFPNVSFACGDLFDLSGSWDVVLCSRVLMHIAPLQIAMERLLAGARRLLVLFLPLSDEDSVEKMRFEGEIFYFRRFSAHTLSAFGPCRIVRHEPYATVVYAR